MAYFDNAATTFPKPECVYTTMDQFYRTNGKSVGRGNYGEAVAAGQIVSDTRKRIQTLLHCPFKQVVFTPTATIALNVVLQGLIEQGAKSFYITPFEHNAVTRTLHHFQRDHISITELTVDSELQYDFTEIKTQFEEKKPDVVVMSHASNVCGLIAPIEEISVLAKKYNATVVIDMAQTAGLIDTNVGLETIDFAIFAGHKTLYGPMGVSGFVMQPQDDFPTVFFGGTGFESANQEMPRSLPERFEIGTQNAVAIAGLNASLNWIDITGIEEIRKREQDNRNKLLQILEKQSFVKTVGIKENCNYVGVVSIIIDGISSDSAGSVFDRLGVSVRTGLQCAPRAHRFLGTYPAGTIRFSVGYFTDENDFNKLKEAMEYISENI